MPTRLKLRTTILALLFLTFSFIIGGAITAHADPDDSTYPKLGEKSSYSYGHILKNGTSQVRPTLFTLQLSNTDSKRTYCIELTTAVNPGTKYNQVLWNESPQTNFVANAAKVNRILHNSYNANTLPEAEKNSGGKQQYHDGLSEKEAIAATQAAIWHFTDGFNYTGLHTDSGASADDAADVETLYNYLVKVAEDQPLPIKDDGDPSLTLTPADTTGYDGESIGPVHVTSTEGEVTTSLLADPPEGVKVHTNEGVEISRSGVKIPADADIFVDVPADLEPGDIDVVTQVRTSGEIGHVFTSPNSQDLILITPLAHSAQNIAHFHWRHAPAITTNATDKADNDKVLSHEGGIIVDTVTATGLTPNTDYVLQGKLIDKDTGESTGIESYRYFTATAEDDETTIEFIVPKGYEGKTLVVFESLFLKVDSESGIGELVALHEDIDDAAQTITVDKAPPPVPQKLQKLQKPHNPAALAKTGTNSASLVIISLLLVSGAGTVLLVRKQQ